jgi:adenylate cyclase
VTYRTYYLGLLAEVLAGQGPAGAEEARGVLEEALALAARTGEGLYEAELYRLRGEARLLGPGEPSESALREAEEDCRRALDVARRQEAKALQLRAAMAVARLARRLGKPEDGRALLAEVYGRFTEGFETPDLAEAREVLGSPP